MPIIITAAGVVIVLIALALIVPHAPIASFCAIRSRSGPKVPRAFTSATERANRKIEKMREKLDGEKTRASDLRGSLNHQVKNVLAKRQGELDQARPITPWLRAPASSARKNSTASSTRSARPRLLSPSKIRSSKTIAMRSTLRAWRSPSPPPRFSASPARSRAPRLTKSRPGP